MSETHPVRFAPLLAQPAAPRPRTTHGPGGEGYKIKQRTVTVRLMDTAFLVLPLINNTHKIRMTLLRYICLSCERDKLLSCNHYSNPLQPPHGPGGRGGSAKVRVVYIDPLSMEQVGGLGFLDVSFDFYFVLVTITTFICLH